MLLRSFLKQLKPGTMKCMLLPLQNKRVLILPFVPFFTGIIVAVFFFSALTESLSPSYIYFGIPLALLVGFIVSLPWLKLFRVEGDTLTARTLWRSERLRISGSKYRLNGNEFQLCGLNSKECITLMPYPRERTHRVVQKLHDYLGLPADTDTSFGATENRKRKWEIIIGACVLLVLLLWFMGVSQATCDPGSDCSAFGVLSTLFSGVRETIGVFVDLFWIALGKGK